MAYSHTISSSDKTVLVHATEVIDLRSTIMEMHALASEHIFEPHFRIFVDLRQVRLNFSTADLFAIRDALDGLRDRYRGGITLIASESELYIAKLACMIVNTAEFQVEAVTRFRAAHESDHRSRIE